MMEKPLFGWGWGSVDTLLNNLPGIEKAFSHPHNTYARVSVELGLLGVFLFIVCYFLLIYYGYFFRRHNYPLAFLFIFTGIILFTFSMTDSIFYGASRGIPVAILLGIIFAARNEYKLLRRIKLVSAADGLMPKKPY